MGDEREHQPDRDTRPRIPGECRSQGEEERCAGAQARRQFERWYAPTEPAMQEGERAELEEHHRDDQLGHPAGGEQASHRSGTAH